ncbi:MAG: hypothetical protein AAGE52_08340 [Myxococcota bacterium]
MRKMWFVVLALGCGGPQQSTVSSFTVTFATEADEGVPLSGVAVSANGANVGASDDDGLVQTMLRGPDGAEVQITYECPEGYHQPEGAKTLRLHHFQALDPTVQTGLHMNLGCVPLQRQAVFVVRTGKADLPVLLDGQEVARTNEAGVAHIIRTADANTDFRLKIDTTGNPRLRPQEPGMQFRLEGHDEVFTWDQSFEEERAPTRRRRRRRRRPRPTVITRL